MDAGATPDAPRLVSQIRAEPAGLVQLDGKLFMFVNTERTASEPVKTRKGWSEV